MFEIFLSELQFALNNQSYCMQANSHDQKEMILSFFKVLGFSIIAYFRILCSRQILKKFNFFFIQIFSETIISYYLIIRFHWNISLSEIPLSKTGRSGILYTICCQCSSKDFFEQWNFSFCLGIPLQTNIIFLMSIFHSFYSSNMIKRRQFFMFDLRVGKVK